MKNTRLSLILLSAVVSIGLVFSSINCMGMGAMYGNVGVNISDQPIWGPTGYDHADFYYIPDIDSYYSISERQYIYRDGSNWIHASSLPARYSSYDPYHSYKVVMNTDKPYQNNESHQAQYKAHIGKKDQPVIRDSHDPKYFVNKNHPEHEKWVKDQNH